MQSKKFTLPRKKIAEFCKRWSITEFSLFGSVLREDLNPDSDIDVLVIPGNFAVILFGVVYGLMIGAPILGFLQGASRNWLLVSNILLLLGFLNVPLVSAVSAMPRGKLFDAALKDALARGEMTSELHAHINDQTVRIVHFIELAVLGFITFLMVFKPF